MQVSCFEQITRARNAQPFQQRPFQAPVQNQQATQFQQPMQQQTPVQRPQPVVYQQPLYPNTQQAPVQVQRAQPSPHPVPPGYNMGWWQDPLAVTMAANPVPQRPQFEGETLAARVGKNIALAMAEALLTQGVLIIRQMVFPPTERRRRDE